MEAMELKIDPEFKALIPPLSEQERAGLEQSILNEGCRDAIVVWDGIIIDGHNRYEICMDNGLEFDTVEREFEDRDAAKDWIDANQLSRRNLTPDQMSILRGRRYNRTKARRGAPAGNANASKQKSQNATIDSASTIANESGVHRATIIRDEKRYKQYEDLKRVAPEEAEAVHNGKKRMREVQREIKLAKVQEASKLPDAKFRIIYADPPWQYNDTCTEGAIQSSAVLDHYPHMSLKQLCEMEIPDIVESDAVLFLWTTSPLLEDAFQVIRAWGFKYKSSFVWDKVKHNMGHYNSVRHEFLLVCTRGSCVPDNRKLFDSVQSIERTKHSEKPEWFREMIDTLYPHGKRIELFARQQAKGWQAYGNQC